MSDAGQLGGGGSLNTDRGVPLSTRRLKKEVLRADSSSALSNNSSAGHVMPTLTLTLTLSLSLTLTGSLSPTLSLTLTLTLPRHVMLTDSMGTPRNVRVVQQQALHSE